MIRAILSLAFATPLALLAQPANDGCANPIAIACGQAVDGTTTGASNDSAPFCGTTVSAPGVWYAFVGNGQQVSITTCPDEQYDTKLNVYTGGCSTLTCVAGNDDDPDAGSYCSTVVFFAEQGVTYRVLVQGYAGETGPFTLAIDCISCGAPLNPAITASDVSATATWVSLNSGATFFVEYGPVGFAPGTGTVLSGTVGTDGPPVVIGGLAPATAYEAYIREQCGSDQGPVVGPIAFTTLSAPPAANAQCAGALPIACGGNVTGNTAQGLVAVAPTCGAASSTARGLWYAFTGNGDDATLSTCAGSAYDTKISVFTGGCAALACVAGSDDGPDCPGNTSLVTLQTQPGTAYLVLVHGYGDDEGDFTLTLACAPPCEAVSNDRCADASELTVQPFDGCESSTGTTQCAFAAGAPNPPCDPYDNVVDTWYAFNTGWATAIRLIIEPGTAPYVNAALYTACATPGYINCWTEADGPIDINGLQQNTTYLVRVWNGGGAQAGTFSICVEGNITVGMDAPAPAALWLWPVPVADALRIADAAGARELAVADATGRVVLRLRPQPAPFVELDARALAPGAYSVLADGRFAGRFVKE